VGRLEPGGASDLPLEALGIEGGSEFWLEQLKRNLTFVLEVAGEIDRGHAPTSQLALEPIAIAESLGKMGRKIGKE